MSATATGKIIIKGQNNIGSAIKSASKDLNSLSAAATKVGDVLKKAFSVTAIVVATKKLGDALSDCFTAFNEAERKYKQLSITLGNTKAYDSVTKKIKELSKITLSSKDDIESMVSELAGLGYSSKEIEKISEAAVHLSNVTGKDLNSSMQTLMNTYNGTTTQLKRLGIDTSNLTKNELANGAAVDLVISKYQGLSKAMAEADSSQHIQNIKNNLGDLKQSIGDLVNFSIAPLLGKIDAFTEKAAKAVDDFVQRVKLVFENFAEIFAQFKTALFNSFTNLFKLDTVKAIVEALFTYIVNKIKLIGNAIANLGELVFNILSETIKAIGNYAMGWIVQISDSLGINISEVINSIGKWLTESSIGKVVDQIISKAVNGVRLIFATIGNIPALLKIIFKHLGDLLKNFFAAIPSAIGNLFAALVERGKYLILHLKNSFLQAIEDAITSLGNAIQSTWVGKALAWMGLDLGGKLASVDLGVNRDSENQAYSNSENYMSKVGESFAGVGAVIKEVGKEIKDLMNPTFEKFVADNSRTIGQTLATWTAKSTDEYYAAAKENFSNIGDFLQDWGKKFLGDLGDDWEDVKTSLQGVFDGVFGSDWDSFIAYLKRVTRKEDKTENNNTGTGTNTNNVAAASGDPWKTVLNELLGSLGEAGAAIQDLITNIAAFGGLIGLIVTAVKEVIKGFAEVVSGPLNENFKQLTEPLKEFGRILGELTLPVIKMLQPFLERIADASIKIFGAIGAVIEPIIGILNSALLPVIEIITNALEVLAPVIKIFAKILVTVVGTIQYIVQTIQHWVATVLNWLAGLNILGWQPFAGLRTTDPGSPGSYSDFIQSKWAAVDEGFERTSSLSGTSTAQAVTNASYSGATTIHLNVYQNGVVVGDGGITQFAVMIRDVLEELNYSGR